MDEDEVIEEMKLLLSKGDVEGIIDNLWAYNDEKYSTLHKKLKEVSELEEMTLVRVGAEQMHRVNEYIAGNIDAYTLQKELSTAGFQLAFLYKQEKDSLESSAEYKAKEIFKDLVSLKKDVFMEKYKSMEVDALFSNNQYLSIYQLKDIPENEGYYFMPSDYFIKNAKPVDINCYELIYTEETNQAMDNDAIFHRFNREHQEGYVGHALSVGDIIVQNNGTELNVSFVDSFGFEKVEDFVNEYAVETPERYILIEKENGEVFSTEYSKETYEKSTMTLHNEVDIKDVIHSLKKEKEIRPYDVNKLKEQIKQAEIKQKQQNYINNQSKRKPKL